MTDTQKFDDILYGAKLGESAKKEISFFYLQKELIAKDIYHKTSQNPSSTFAKHHFSF